MPRPDGVWATRTQLNWRRPWPTCWRAKLEAADLSAIAVAIGPGSYTGLRIGLGLAKGLALANQTRLIGVPTLDIVAASQPQSDGKLVAICEAGRTRVCAGFYRWEPGKGWQNVAGDPTIESWEELLAGIEEPAHFAGEIGPEGAKLIRASAKSITFASAATSVRRAGCLAEIGLDAPSTRPDR